MANNLDVVFFKNKIIDNLTGRNTTIQPIWYLIFYTGAKPATPSTAPAGVALNAFAALPTIHTQGSMGVAALSAPRAITPNATGTASFARMGDVVGNLVADFDCGVSGSGAEVIVSTTSFVSGTPINVTNFSWRMPPTLSTLKLNADIRNRLVDSFLQTIVVAAAAMGVSGTINIYSGAAPASADSPPTGTLLATFTTAASPGSWLAASGGSAALVTNLTTTGIAAGTAGYAVWTKGLFVIMGSVGTSAADFILDTLAVTIGGALTLTDATITY